MQFQKALVLLEASFEKVSLPWVLKKTFEV